MPLRVSCGVRYLTFVCSTKIRKTLPRTSEPFGLTTAAPQRMYISSLEEQEAAVALLTEPCHEETTCDKSVGQRTSPKRIEPSHWGSAKAQPAASRGLGGSEAGPGPPSPAVCTAPLVGARSLPASSRSRPSQVRKAPCASSSRLLPRPAPPGDPLHGDPIG